MKGFPAISTIEINSGEEKNEANVSLFNRAGYVYHLCLS